MSGENVFSYKYDLTNKITTKTDVVGSVWRYKYDDKQVITEETDPNGGKTVYAYDDNGRLTGVIDAMGEQWLANYDNRGRVVSRTNPENEVSQWQYEGDNYLPSRFISPSGRVTEFVYDAKRNLLSIKYPAGQVSQMEWDGNGYLTAQVNTLGERTEYTNNGFGLPVSVGDPSSHITNLAYDAAGNIVSVTDPVGSVTQTAYNAMGRDVSIANPLNAATQMTYDLANNLTSVTEANGRTTTYEYDQYGRLIRRIDPAGRKYEYTYRADNLLETVIMPNGDTIHYDYDAAKNITSEDFVGNITTYAYSIRHELISASNENRTVTISYDKAGRRIAEVIDGRSVALTLNSEGELIGIDADGVVTTITRDTLGRVNQIDAPEGQYDFQRDTEGKRTALTLPNSSSVTYEYDDRGALTRLTHAGALNVSYTYNIDGAGRVLGIADGQTNRSYAYDSAWRLTSFSDGGTGAQFAFDAIGNIAENGRNYDEVNRLLEDDDFEYSYNANGNLNEKRAKPVPSGARVAYMWDARGQLIRVERFEGGSSTVPAEVTEYSYGPLGRRLTKAQNGNLVQYLYYGMDAVATYDAAGGRVSSVTFGPAVDEPLGGQSASGNFFYHADHQGSILVVSDANGAVLAAYEYGPFGQTIETLANIDNVYRYTGREYDAPDLYFYRARYYDPTNQRFLSEDPIGSFSTSVSQYAYAENSPVIYNDPDGEFVNYIIGGGASVLTGYLISKLTGCDYSFTDALIDAGTGALGVGIASKAQKLYRISKLRRLAKSRGLAQQAKKGYTETWKAAQGLEKLNIKHQAAKSAGLQKGSYRPRFDYRIDAGKYWDPFTGHTGPKGALSHVPLSPLGPGGAAGVGAGAGAAGGAARGGCDDC